MSQIKHLFLSRRFAWLLLGLLLLDGAALAIKLAAQPAAPAHAQGIRLLPPSIKVDSKTSQAAAAALVSESPRLGVFTFAITDVSQQAGYTILSVAGFAYDQPDKWTLDQAIWMGNVTLGAGQQAGQVPALVNSLDPAPQPGQESPNLGTGGSGDILPFAKGTQAQYGVAGVHDCGFGLTGWKAVDLFTADNNAYSSTGGEVSYVCRDSTQVSVRIGSHLYAHLVDNGIQTGQQVNQGQLISSLVKGTFNDTCGNASQNAAYGHIHFCFQPEGGGSYTSDGYTLSTINQNWVKGGETVSPLGYLTASWQNAGANVTPNSAIGSNFWDGIAGAFSTLGAMTAGKFPQHTAMGLAERIVGIAVIPLKLVYSVILVNFNMTVFIWCFGIIMTLEAARLIYSAYMWVKRAIPVVG